MHAPQPRFQRRWEWGKNSVQRLTEISFHYSFFKLANSIESIPSQTSHADFLTSCQQLLWQFQTPSHLTWPNNDLAKKNKSVPVYNSSGILNIVIDVGWFFFPPHILKGKRGLLKCHSAFQNHNKLFLSGRRHYPAFSFSRSLEAPHNRHLVGLKVF